MYTSLYKITEKEAGIIKSMSDCGTSPVMEYVLNLASTKDSDCLIMEHAVLDRIVCHATCPQRFVKHKHPCGQVELTWAGVSLVTPYMQKVLGI